MFFLFKRYKHSLLATVFSYAGSLALCLGVLMAISVVGCISRGDWSTTALTESWLPMLLLLAVGVVCKILAKKRAAAVWEKKIREDIDFAVATALENPEAAEAIKALNPAAADAIDTVLTTRPVMTEAQ